MEIFWRDLQLRAQEEGLTLEFLKFENENSSDICFEIVESSFIKASNSYESYQVGFLVRSHDLEGLISKMEAVTGTLLLLPNTDISEDYIVNLVDKLKLEEYFKDEDYYYALLLYNIQVTNKKNL